MLEQLDLTRELSKEEYRARMQPLKFEMYQIGRAVFESKTPVLVVFEGVGTAGMGRAITSLVTRLDPRGYRVYPISAASEREERFPWLHRFWLRTPARGELAIFHGSWYRRVLIDRVAKNMSKKESHDDASSRKLLEWRRVRDDVSGAYRDIQDFERILADDGVVIQKFWLHVDRAEQKRRIKKLLASKTTAWRVGPDAQSSAKRFEDFIFAAEEMFGYTQAEYAPWSLISAMERRWMTVQVFETLIARLKPFVSAHMLELAPQELAEQQALDQEI